MNFVQRSLIKGFCEKYAKYPFTANIIPSIDPKCSPVTKLWEWMKLRCSQFCRKKWMLVKLILNSNLLIGTSVRWTTVLTESIFFFYNPSLVSPILSQPGQ